MTTQPQPSELDALAHKLYLCSIGKYSGEAHENIKAELSQALAQAEVRGAIHELKMITATKKHVGFISPEDGHVYDYKIDAEYFVERLKDLEQQAETQA